MTAVGSSTTPPTTIRAGTAPEMLGYLDAQGRLWIQGRTVHVITTAEGPVTPIGLELTVQEALSSGPSATLVDNGVAAVGVGPAGDQQVAVVLAGPGGPLAPPELLDAVRACVRDGRRGASPRIASVLIMDRLPVDIRHNSKIDRVAVATWAGQVLAGG